MILYFYVEINISQVGERDKVSPQPQPLYSLINLLMLELMSASLNGWLKLIVTQTMELKRMEHIIRRMEFM